ncbi:MAG: hypothetical protein ACLR31_18280 [Escherichia coli]
MLIKSHGGATLKQGP